MLDEPRITLTAQLARYDRLLQYIRFVCLPAALYELVGSRYQTSTIRGVCMCLIIIAGCTMVFRSSSQVTADRRPVLNSALQNPGLC